MPYRQVNIDKLFNILFPYILVEFYNSKKLFNNNKQKYWTREGAFYDHIKKKKKLKWENI